MNEQEQEPKRKRIYSLSELAQLPLVYDPDHEPPFFQVPQYKVADVMIAMTLSDRTLRNKPPPLSVIKNRRNQF